jgi:hypothetical protein
MQSLLDTPPLANYLAYRWPHMVLAARLRLVNHAASRNIAPPPRLTIAEFNRVITTAPRAIHSLTRTEYSLRAAIIELVNRRRINDIRALRTFDTRLDINKWIIDRFCDAPHTFHMSIVTDEDITPGMLDHLTARIERARFGARLKYRERSLRHWFGYKRKYPAIIRIAMRILRHVMRNRRKYYERQRAAYQLLFTIINQFSARYGDEYCISANVPLPIIVRGPVIDAIDAMTGDIRTICTNIPMCSE